MASVTLSSPTLDDVFNSQGDSDNVIIDADVIEAVKENIQPLQKGRRAAALSAIFSTPHAQRDALLSRQRARFRLQITQAFEGYEGDEERADLLDIYSRFVAWTLESYPQGQSAESGLLELLEEATRKLTDMKRYKQDPRYFKLWSLYAGYVDKPAIIYAFLLANEIGTNLAQLYEEYAYVHEHEGRRREADEMYSLGIARKAEPLARLTSRHVDFQRRMIAAPPPPSPPRPVGPAVAGRRTVLGISSSLHSPRSNPMPPRDVFSAPRPNARLQIFVDSTGEAAQRAEGNPWPELGTRASRTKENTAEIRKMGDISLPRSRPTASGPATRVVPFRDPAIRGAFVPFRDDNDAAAMSPPSICAPSRRVVSTSSLEPFRDQTPATPRCSFSPYQDKDARQPPLHTPNAATPTSLAPRPKQGLSTSEAEALRKDPFKNYSIRPEEV